LDETPASTHASTTVPVRGRRTLVDVSAAVRLCRTDVEDRGDGFGSRFHVNVSVFAEAWQTLGATIESAATRS
jgi:hypothetical protein